MCPTHSDNTPTTSMPQQILNFINLVAADPSMRNQVSVLPIMCGSGKSTAISMKIRQTIQGLDNNGRGNGLIVVTNDNNRLAGYMHPHDEALRSFLDANSDKVTILNSGNRDEALTTMHRRPVLLITTQRLFDFSSEQQIESYLRWGNGCVRTLILIDEEAQYKRIFDIDRQSLNEIDTGLHNARSQAENDNQQMEYNWCINFWENSIKRQLTEYMDGFEQEIAPNGHARPYTTESLHYYSPQQLITVDDQLRLKSFVARFRQTINNYDGDAHPIEQLINAVCSIRSFGCLYEFNASSGRQYSNRFVFVAERRSSLYTTYQTAKTIILDGTADPEQPEYASLGADFRACSMFDRDLSNLTIRIVDGGYGKSSFATDRSLISRTSQRINDIISNDNLDRERIGLFTYKDFIEGFKNEVRDVKYGHFGNITGSNDYNDCTTVFQIGMNTQPDSHYFAQQIAIDDELAMLELSSPDADVPSILSRIKDNKSSPFNIIRDRMLLSELEQHIMRGVIRNSNNTEPYTFYLFISVNGYQSLIDKLKARFESLHATVEIVPQTEEERRERSLRRSPMSGSTMTKPQLFYELYRDLTTDEEYDNQLIAIRCGIAKPKDVRSVFRTNRDIIDTLNREKIGPGKYKKM